MLKIICAILVFAGSCTMLATIITYVKTMRSYMSHLSSNKNFGINRYTYILILMIFFLLGYVAILFYIADLSEINMSILLIGTIFFFGAIFCFSVIYVQADLLKQLEYNANELRKALDESKTANITQKALNEELVNAMKALEEAQSRLVFSEKMSTLGKLMAGISHEINTPMGVVRASTQSLQASFSNRFSQLFREIRALTEEDYQNFIYYTETAVANTERYTSTQEMRALKRSARQRLSDSEGFNDTIFNLIAGNCLLDSDSLTSIIPRLNSESFIQIMRLVGKTLSMINSIDNIAISAEKVIKMVTSLKSFSHVGISSEKTIFNVVSGIEAVLAIFANRLKYDVEVITDFDDIPNILGYEDELCQVWSNLIENALHAMSSENDTMSERRIPNKLTLTVKNSDPGSILIKISDNGSGISTEKLEHIFEPFYTTKPTGIGSGLGLSISKQIIGKHNGTIEVDSKEGEGTEFIITLPIKNE